MYYLNVLVRVESFDKTSPSPDFDLRKEIAGWHIFL